MTTNKQLNTYLPDLNKFKPKGVTMADAKELPPVEYSLKSISWHLKVLNEELKRISANLDKLASNSPSGKDLPF